MKLPFMNIVTERRSTGAGAARNPVGELARLGCNARSEWLIHRMKQKRSSWAIRTNRKAISPRTSLAVPGPARAATCPTLR
jgi:hypothetical protein